MVPTVEEYSQLIYSNYEMKDKLYLKRRNLGLNANLAKIMGMKKTEVDSCMANYRKKKNDSAGITSQFFMDFIRENIQQTNIGPVFALLIYGLVIFPKILGHVDEWVVDLFEQVMNNCNPVRAILAETIRSLNQCRIDGEERFQGCAQMLCVWFKSHLCNESYDFREHYFARRRPIREFNKSTRCIRKTKEQWVHQLRNLTSNGVTWKARWMARERVMYRCGDKPWVPLIGPWGVVSYCPLLVRRQYGSQQFIPATHGLRDVDFSYQKPHAHKEAEELLAMSKNATKVSCSYCEQDTTPEYPDWHKQRVKDVKLPPPFDPAMPVGPDMEDVMTQMKIENQRLKEGTVLSEFEKENKELKDATARIKDENDKLTRRVSNLKRSVSVEMVEKEKAKKDCLKLEENMKKKDEEIVILRKKVKSYQEEGERLRNRLKEEMNFAGEMDVKATEMEKKLKRVKEENGLIKGEEAAKRKALEESVLSLKIDLNTQKQNSEVKLEIKQMECDRLVDSLNELEFAYEDLRLQYEELKADGLDLNKKELRQMIKDKDHEVNVLLNQIREVAIQARKMKEEARSIRGNIAPTGPQVQDMIDFLGKIIDQYEQFVGFFKYATTGPVM